MADLLDVFEFTSDSSRASSSTSVSCTPNPAIIGSLVICAATVSGLNQIVPTGIIIWTTSSKTGSFNVSQAATLSSGTYSVKYIDGSIGSVTITASYSGDPNYLPSIGNITLTINQTPSTKFSIFWITDTQHLSGSDHEKFNDLTTWILQNKENYNLQMVIHTGDIIEGQDSSTSIENSQQWTYANDAMNELLGKVPYCWCAGNHDNENYDTNWLEGNPSDYNALDASAMSTKQPNNAWVSYFNQGQDTEARFSYGGKTFIVMDIGFNDITALDYWVKPELEKYKTSNDTYFILGTHAFINAQGSTNDPTWGPTLKTFTSDLTTNILEKYSNVILTLNGHFTSSSDPAGYYQKAGNVNEMMYDRQELDPKPGDTSVLDGAASVTILTFNLLNSKVEVKTYDLNPSDDQSHFLLNSFDSSPAIGPAQQFVLSFNLPFSFTSTNVSDLVVRGQDNIVYYRTFNATTASWADWNSLPGATLDSPAATICSNELHIVVRGTDGNTLWHGYVNLASNAFSGWSALAGSSPSTPTLTSNGTHVAVLVRGGNDLVYYELYSLASRSWGSWLIVPSGSTSDSVAAALVGNELHIAVRGISGDLLWYCSGNLASGVWSGWSGLGGTSPSPATFAGNNTHLALMVRGSNNLIYYKLYNLASRTWGNWLIVPNGSTGSRPAATFAGGLLQIVVRGESGGVPWHGRMNLDSNVFSGWTALAGSTPSPPTLTS